MTSIWFFGQRRQRQALDAFWDTVVERSPAEPVRPETVEPGAAATIRHLLGVAGQPRPDGDFGARLLAELSATIPENPALSLTSTVEKSAQEGKSTMLSATLAAPTPFPAPASDDHRVIDLHSRRTLLSLAAAIMLLLAGIGGYFTLYDRNEGPSVIPAVIQSDDATPESSSASDVPMYRGNPARTGEMPGPGPEGSPVELWRAQTQGRIANGISIADGAVYVHSGDGMVHALDLSDGAELWTSPVAGSFHTTVSDQFVYVGSDDGNLHALDRTTGEEQWLYEAGGLATVTSPVDGVLYGAADQGLAFALDAVTGEELWSRQVTSANFRGPAMENGTLYFGADDGSLYALSADSGQELWSFATARMVVVTPAVRDGVVYISPRIDGPLEGALFAVDALTGKEIWRFVTPSNSPFTTPTLADGIVYVDSADGAVYAVDMDTGEQLWASTKEAALIGPATMLVDGIVYEMANERTLRALDAANGAELWRFEADGFLGQFSATGGALYFGTEGGSVYAVGGSGEVENASATPAPVAAADQNATSVTAEFAWVSTGGSQPLSEPTTLAIHPLDDSIWVLDNGNNQIQILEPDGSFRETFGSAGNGDGQFDFSTGGIGGGLAFDAVGNLYVSDIRNQRVQKFDAEGNFLFAWGSEGEGDGQFLAADGVVVDADGNVYVSDTFRNDVQKFSSDGQYLLTIGEFGSEQGQLNLPSYMAVDESGNLYVADNKNARISKFAPDGTILATFGSFGSGDGEFTGPNGVDVDAAGNIYVADSENNRVQVLDPSGKFLMQFGTMGVGDGEFTGPANVVIDDQGNLYTAEVGNGRVQKFVITNEP